MKVKILRGFCLGGGINVNPGDVTEISDREATLKIAQGKAALFVEEQSEQPAPIVEIEPVVEPEKPTSRKGR